MLKTQRQSVAILRFATGRSIRWCEEQIRQMPKVLDGSREKIRTADLNRAIAIANEPPPEPKSTIRPISARMIEKMQRMGAI